MSRSHVYLLRVTAATPQHASATVPPTAPPTALPGTDAAIARYGGHGRRWLTGMWLGDPLADAVVADGAAGLVRQAIAGGIEAVEDAPAALRALFAELDTLPDWFDGDRCDRAAGHLARQAREYGLVLGAASLLLGAQSAVAGKPLTFTGRYATNAAVRSIEVAAWLDAVTTPGGLRRDGRGFQHTVRVRMIHAHVRAYLTRHPGWDADAWGLPIPQPYMSFTLAEFCSIPVRTMHMLGVRFSDRELEDIHHLWRVVGRLVGVAPEYLPATATEYARIEDLYALTAHGADDGDRAFVGALTEFQVDELGRFLPRPLATSIMHGLQRAFIGDAVADDLRIPATRWRHLPALIGPLQVAGYAVHDRLVPDGRARRTRRMYRVRTRELQRLRTSYGVGHELVDDVS